MKSPTELKQAALELVDEYAPGESAIAEMYWDDALEGDGDRSAGSTPVGFGGIELAASLLSQIILGAVISVSKDYVIDTMKKIFPLLKDRVRKAKLTVDDDAIDAIAKRIADITR